MWKSNARSAVFAATLASTELKQDGLLVLVGAQAALQPTPGMFAYGMAKAATLHLCTSLAADPSLSWSTVCLLPNTIDSIANR